MPEIGVVKVADVMTRDPAVTTPETPIADAVRLMLDRRISGLPVVDERGLLCGLMTEGDLLRRAELGTQHGGGWLARLLTPAQAAKDFAHAHGRKVGDVMTRHVVWVTEGTPLADAIEAMEKCHLKRLPVLRGGRPVGIVSRADVIEALGRQLERQAAAAPPDRAIKRALGEAFHEYAWDRNRPQFKVHDGVVDLYWIGESLDWERKAARVAAESTPGVRAVHEHLLEG